MIKVDQEKCIGCAICADICPVSYIGMDAGYPITVGNVCIACGHCVAACPKAALDNTATPLLNQVTLEKSPVLDAAMAETFIRARRSVRVYKDIAVPRNKILKLLDIARLAPTGGNTQGVQYLVIDDRVMLQRITKATVAWMDEMVAAGAVGSAYFAGLVEYYHKTGRDIILRDAPCLILAMADKSFMPRGRDNTHFSLAYAELFAPSLGLASCWVGFIESCAMSGYQPLLGLLSIPEELIVTGGIMVGYSKYTYHRLVDRNPLKVTWQ